MNTLIIDCSNGLNIWVNANGKTYQYSNLQAKKQSDSLLAEIDDLIKQAGLTIKQISVIAVNVGPGSFTGIRVAISTAKGLAIGSGAKVITFNSFESVSAGITDKNYGVITLGFGNNYYYYFKKFGKVFQGCATPDKLEVLAKDTPIYSLYDSVCNSITQYNVLLAKNNTLKAVEEKINKQMFVQTNQISPLYLRASQAELERLKNGN